MAALVVIGWLIITIIAVIGCIGTFLLTVVASKFSGNVGFEWVFPAAIALLFGFWSYTTFPFSVHVVL